MSAAKVVVVIPARYGSIRLPGKPLVLLAGKPMIQRVYERAKLAGRADRVIVATDDERIVKAVEGFGGEARMTRTEHRTGTERVAEVAAHEQGEVFVNVQGDEPLLDPNAIDVAVNSLLEEPQASISTVAAPSKAPGDIRRGGSLPLGSNLQGCRAIEPAMTRLVSTPTRKTVFESTA